VRHLFSFPAEIRYDLGLWSRDDKYYRFPEKASNQAAGAAIGKAPAAIRDGSRPLNTVTAPICLRRF